MKFTKLTIIFLLLLACAVSISAQDEKSKVVWGNLKDTYSSFAEIQPHIRNVSDKDIYLYPNYYLQVLVFSEKNQKWSHSKYHFITDYNGRKTPKSKPIKLKSGDNHNYFGDIYWNHQLLGENGAFQDYDKPDWNKMPDYKTGRKYKITTYYSIRKKKDLIEIESPEFWVTPKEQTK